MNKKTYEAPSCTVISLSAEDLIVTSNDCSEKFHSTQKQLQSVSANEIPEITTE